MRHVVSAQDRTPESVANLAAMSAPLIGITSADRTEEVVVVSPWYDESYSVPAQYIDAVRRAGGVPVMLPPGETNWDQWLDVLDGVIVTGGVDVAAEHYDGDPDHPEQQNPRHDRDDTELALAKRLVDGQTPALFVCRGMQVLNVALGGTLHQHLADEIEDNIHKLEGDGWAYHDAELKAGSLVAKASGTDRVHGATGHHQAINQLAVGLEATGWADDGVVEALEVPGDTWLVAVQWHPEVTAGSDPAQQGLFDALVQAAHK